MIFGSKGIDWRAPEGLYYRYLISKIILTVTKVRGRTVVMIPCPGSRKDSELIAQILTDMNASFLRLLFCELRTKPSGRLSRFWKESKDPLTLMNTSTEHY